MKQKFNEKIEIEKMKQSRTFIKSIFSDRLTMCSDEEKEDIYFLLKRL